MKKAFVIIVLLLLLTSTHTAVAAVGDKCVPTDPTACTGSADVESCNQTTNTCQSADAGTAAPSSGGAASANTGGGLNANATNFVSLTNLPGLSDIVGTSTGSAGTAKFLQNVYKICIGLAAVLAVLQLIRAGVMYMGGDSVTETRKARELIGTTLFGLLLVLSPVIVFSIINPSILSLNIGISNLQSNASTDSSASTPAAPSSATMANGQQCSSLTKVEYVPVPDGKACFDVMAGNNVHSVDLACCSGASTQAGYECCASQDNPQ